MGGTVAELYISKSGVSFAIVTNTSKGVDNGTLNKVARNVLKNISRWPTHNLFSLN